MNIRIKYQYPDTKRLEFIGGIETSNWIDLATDECVTLLAGEDQLINLGVAMELPYGYEAHVVPRSSTFKNFKIILANHHGVIDGSYCGDNDWWKFWAIALHDTFIPRGSRICQFRIERVQPPVAFEEVEILGNNDRGGHGSTGI